jgi:5-methylcytosine-specific restriction endonuclease McrA
MQYIFRLAPGTSTDAVPEIRVFARNRQEAQVRVTPLIPMGSRVWAVFEYPENSCTLCHGPFHPSLGHWESLTRHWCWACTRSMVALLKETQNRRCGGVRFYDHAFPPPAVDTSAEDLASS